jgi:hypothetical protein
MKTVTSFVYSSPSAISTSVNAPFSIYIGDDISLVASPIKSVYFTATGIYTGGGTFAFSLNSSGGSTKTFTMPNVGSTPTRFTLLYKDPSGIIAPTTAGTFTYTLNMVPSGVTLSGLGVDVSVTYEYTESSCPDGQATNQKIKTEDTFVYSSAGQISTSVNAPVSLYIGNDISGIATPIKSAYFTITGLYTGGGSYAFTLDGNGATTKSFAMPSVGGTPTPFSLKYKDTTGEIAPTTAGTYAYTLAMVPTGVTLSGLGVVLTVTYQHKPAACAGYPPTGELESTTFDTTGSVDGAAYNSIMWRGNLGGPSQTIGHVRFQLATSASPSGPWSYAGGATCTAGDWFDPGAQDTPNEQPVFPIQGAAL